MSVASCAIEIVSHTHAAETTRLHTKVKFLQLTAGYQKDMGPPWWVSNCSSDPTLLSPAVPLSGSCLQLMGVGSPMHALDPVVGKLDAQVSWELLILGTPGSTHPTLTKMLQYRKPQAAVRQWGFDGRYRPV